NLAPVSSDALIRLRQGDEIQLGAPALKEPVAGRFITGGGVENEKPGDNAFLFCTVILNQFRFYRFDLQIYSTKRLNA
ncbi:hypothetical protein O5559_29215, partial [Escherichia coli]|nr:hypothetical protein [Escherichia coli]